VRYLEYGALDGVPNIVVDGARHADSLLVLSHWPKSGSPVALRADLSAQIAFNYLEHLELHVPAEAVSNNHFDQDGLMSMYALVDPAGALARRSRAIDVARAGDFNTYAVDRDSMRITWTIAGLAAAMPDDEDPYASLLPRLPELLDEPSGFPELWAEEDSHLASCEAAIESGHVTIEELPEIDLAIVTVPESWAPLPVHKFTPVIERAVHPTAVNNATDLFRVLYVHGSHYELEYRYETWVQYESRRPPGRVDLTSLAAELSALESGDAQWTFDGVGMIGPTLHLVAADSEPASAIPPDVFRARVIETLTTGESAWDPYD
jgi:hypothetical protein